MQAHVTDEPTKLGNARAPRCDGRSGIGVLAAGTAAVAGHEAAIAAGLADRERTVTAWLDRTGAVAAVTPF